MPADRIRELSYRKLVCLGLGEWRADCEDDLIKWRQPSWISDYDIHSAGIGLLINSARNGGSRVDNPGHGELTCPSTLPLIVRNRFQKLSIAPFLLRITELVVRRWWCTEWFLEMLRSYTSSRMCSNWFISWIFLHLDTPYECISVLHETLWHFINTVMRVDYHN